MLFLFGLFQWGTAVTIGQDTIRFHLVRYIEVETDALNDFRNAVEEKTKTFNSSEESSRWWTYRISGGKRSGQFARGFGNVTAEQLDQPQQGRGHGYHVLNLSQHSVEAHQANQLQQPHQAENTDKLQRTQGGRCG